MDVQRIHDALSGELELSDLSVAERLAMSHTVVAARVERPAVAPRATPLRYVLPEHIERLYRGRSS